MKIQSNFVLRTLTGAVFVAAILASMLSFWSFALLMSIVLLLTVYEYQELLAKKGIEISQRAIGALVFAPMTMIFFFYGESFATSLSTTFRPLCVALFIFSFLLLFVEGLYSKKENPIQNLIYAIFAFFYMTLPFVCLIYLHRFNPLFALALFSFVWINDTFAYLVGITMGKHKLFERISPKKSWEGFFGGLIFAVLAGIAFHHFTTDIFENYSLIKWIGLALMVVISATFGDLFESLFKRSLDVKDSGTFLPGHGGFLDRLDSILFAAPAMILYLLLIKVIL